MSFLNQLNGLTERPEFEEKKVDIKVNKIYFKVINSTDIFSDSNKINLFIEP